MSHKTKFKCRRIGTVLKFYKILGINHVKEMFKEKILHGPLRSFSHYFVVNRKKRRC